VPLVGDFHYNGHTLLNDHPACAEALAKYRINPGNVGFREKKDRNFAMMVETAIRFDRPVRIGVNWGSLDQALLTELMDRNAKSATPRDVREVMHEAVVQSGLLSAERAIEIGLPKDRIIISAKCSEVQDLIAVYRSLAARCDHALHLGLTEAGMGSKGIVASTAALAVLLQEGIGDTIRISLTPEPGGDRSREVIVAQEILQTMGLRAFAPMVIACPGCGRTTSTVFQELAQDIQAYVRSRMADWRRDYPGFETLQLAVMGCIVNGPGESKHADIGISLPGTGELPAAPIFIDGKKAMTLRGEDISRQFSDGLIHKAACLVPRAIEPQQVDKGRLAHALVLLGRLAERLRGRLHVKNVVSDLEGEADGFGIAPQGCGIAPAQHRARLAGEAEEGARLQTLNPDNVRKI